MGLEQLGQNVLHGPLSNPSLLVSGVHLVPVHFNGDVTRSCLAGCLHFGHRKLKQHPGSSWDIYFKRERESSTSTLVCGRGCAW